jgi:AcrR family transcriptional regulator
MQTKPPGRPRSEHLHGAILAAARELVLSVGYEKLSMEAIAAQAGVGKQTVYRRWPSKAAVVAEAILAAGDLPGQGKPLPDTGDLATDLVAWSRVHFDNLTDPATTTLLRALATAASERESDASRLNEELTGLAREQIIQRLASGQRAGQVRADASLDAAADAILGVITYRLLSGRPAAHQAGACEVIDLILRGIGSPA